MVRLIILSGAMQGREIPLRPGLAVVGRRDDCAVVLPDPSVSGHHCEIQVSDLNVRIRDLGSTNGTQVAGQAIDRPVEVTDGQVVEVGDVQVRFSVPPVEISIPSLPSADEPTQPFLADGCLACFNHPAVPAAFQCHQCRRAYCASCVKDLHVAGGASHLLCPHCSAQCATVAPPPPPPKGLMAVLKKPGGVFDTIRIAFSRGPRPKP